MLVTIMGLKELITIISIQWKVIFGDFDWLL